MHAPILDTYTGAGPWAICDRCGLKHRLNQLRKEWTGLMVCRADFDPKPREISTRPKFKPEGLPLPNARPDPGDVLGPNTTTADDL